MNKEIKKLWIEALRSGKYTQGHNELHSPDGSMCCLGVLCDLYRKETSDGEWVLGDTRYRFKVHEHSVNLMLPIEVADWAQINIDMHNSLRTSVHLSEHDHNLVMHNDGAVDRKIGPKNFNEIADLIEQYL